MIGGYEKQLVVQPGASWLAAYGVSFSDLAQALERDNISVGANFVQRAGEAFLVRADSRLRSDDEIGRTAIATIASGSGSAMQALLQSSVLNGPNGLTLA